MLQLSEEWDDYNPHKTFPSEESMRLNADHFKHYGYTILEERRLPLSHIALSVYYTLLNNAATDMRKDGVTRRDLHELSHLDVMDKLLIATGSRWIDSGKYGSEDALFAALILHDVIEDFKISPKVLEEMVRDALVGLRLNLGDHEDIQEEQIDFDLDQTIKIVELLSRKDHEGNLVVGEDRLLQADRWLDHPYAFVIKMIDWSNKLQTMPGVKAFEKKKAFKMQKVLDETGLLFVDEQQGFIRQAIDRYPEIKEPCEMMEGIMGMMFQMVNTYRKLVSKDFIFDPINARPFNFDQYLNQSRKLLSIMVSGNNYIGPVIERFENIGETNLLVGNFLNHMVKPAFTQAPSFVAPALKL